MSAVDKRPEGLIKISGTIRNYRVTRGSANFVFTDTDKTKLGVVAIAAGIAHFSGQAMAVASSASAEEDADYVEFDLEGEPVRGWLWRSPFTEGDVVNVAAEWQGDHYEAGGIARPNDRILALYPHCSRGTARHVKVTVKWWFIGTTSLMLVGLIPGFYVFPLAELLKGYPFMAAGFYIFFAIAATSLARKWMVFVRLAERVFKTLGLSDPGNIDLVESSKAQRKANDSGEFGTFYFRY